MKIFDRSSKLEHVSYDIRGPILDEATRMTANGKEVLRLNTGDPAEFGFTTPDEVIRDLIANARDSETYSDSKGIFSARKVIMQYYQLEGFPHVDIDDIYLGNGVSELISMSLQAFLDGGNEALVPIPNYPLRTACASLAGGNAVHYLCDEKTSWYPDIGDIKSKITSNTKVIVVINPNNPTSALYPDELLKEIAEIARQNDLIIFADEIYGCSAMDSGKHTAIASLAPDVFYVSTNGLSKSYRICGFRVGWMVLSGPKNNAKDYIEGLNMLTNMHLCTSVLGRHVVQTSLGGYQSVNELLIPGGRIYEQCNFIYKAVNEVPGLSAVKPGAGLYVLPRIDREMYQIDDDEQFCLGLLKQEKVVLVPDKGFNWNEPDRFRIVYLPRVEELAEVREKLTQILNQYQH